jgi:hypothetical protein
MLRDLAPFIFSFSSTTTPFEAFAVIIVVCEIFRIAPMPLEIIPNVSVVEEFFLSWKTISKQITSSGISLRLIT